MTQVSEGAESAMADETGKPADAPAVQGDAQQGGAADQADGARSTHTVDLRFSEEQIAELRAEFAELHASIVALVAEQVEPLKQEIARLAEKSAPASLESVEERAASGLAAVVEVLNKRLTTLELRLRHF